MQIVIEIDEEIYKGIKMGMRNRDDMAEIGEAVENGTPLPKGHERKALEQEPIFDKIRAEITNIPIADTDGHNSNWYREPQAIINDVLQIIDKYKAESEVSDETCD